MVHKFNIDNSFDIITQRGKLYRKSSVMVYQIGLSATLVNGYLVKSGEPVIRDHGEVLIPISIFSSTLSKFFPGIDISSTREALIARNIREHEPDADISAPATIQKTSKDRISFIIIDPGHGGKDPGAIGYGTYEKNITLRVSRDIVNELKLHIPDTHVILTRNNDRFIELSKRTEIANKHLTNNSNGIFVSIHVNASLSKKISGFETYFLSQNPTNEEARTTATLENNVIIMENKSSKGRYNDVEYLEALMLTTQIQKESSILAQSIQNSLDKRIHEFKSRGVKKADFFVLRGTLMPAALVEIGYISHRDELQHLKKRPYQKKIAKGISDGIIRFIKKYNSMIKNK
jgi:N-acetylmuramoyl-L-alanine amidase